MLKCNEAHFSKARQSYHKSDNICKSLDKISKEARLQDNRLCYKWSFQYRNTNAEEIGPAAAILEARTIHVNRIVILSIVSNLLSSLEDEHPIDILPVILNGVFHVLVAGFVEIHAAVIRCHPVIIRQISSDMVSSAEVNIVWQDDARAQS